MAEVIELTEDTHPAALGSLVALLDFDPQVHHPAAVNYDHKQQHCEAMEMKVEANRLFGAKMYDDAMELYSKAIKICPYAEPYAADRAILHNNRAACLYNLGELEEALEDCSEAIEANPRYVKPYLRRAQIYEKQEKLDDAHKDLKSVLEIDPSLTTARRDAMRLEKEINERNEKMKEEMMSKLKDLGNMFLGKFGLSTDNFQMKQDPGSGSYNIQFVQNKN